MIRFLISTAIFLGSAAIGLIIASVLLDDFEIDVGPFLLVVAIFALIQMVLSPFIASMFHKNAQALTGAAGVGSTFVALLITDIVSDGLSIEGAFAWILGTLIVWLVTMAAAFLLPMIFVKNRVEERRAAQ